MKQKQQYDKTTNKAGVLWIAAMLCFIIAVGIITLFSGAFTHLSNGLAIGMGLVGVVLLVLAHCILLRKKKQNPLNDIEFAIITFNFVVAAMVVAVAGVFLLVLFGMHIFMQTHPGV